MILKGLEIPLSNTNLILPPRFFIAMIKDLKSSFGREGLFSLSVKADSPRWEGAAGVGGSGDGHSGREGRKVGPPVTDILRPGFLPRGPLDVWSSSGGLIG